MSDVREGWEVVQRGKEEGTYVDDPLRHKFTPPEGIEQCLEFSMSRQEIRCPDVGVLGEIRKTFRYPGKRGGVVELVKDEL